MKTHDLIALLANETLPSSPPPWLLPLAAAAALAVTLTMVVQGWGLHANLPELLVSFSYQFKTLWVIALALSSGVLLWRLARPAQRIGNGVHVIFLAWLAMAIAGAYSLIQVDASERINLMMGQSWWSCPLSIALIALPWLAVGLLYLRHMAPTNLVFSGAAAGLFSGALATGLYSLHCIETSFAFFSVWYAAGIALSTALGAFLGRRCLRW
jgi:hypothetical protein